MTPKPPIGMTLLSLANVTPTSITISWPALTDPKLDGGDPPIFYSVEWSSDNFTWTVLNPAGGPLDLNYT